MKEGDECLGYFAVLLGSSTVIGKTDLQIGSLAEDVLCILHRVGEIRRIGF